MQTSLTESFVLTFYYETPTAFHLFILITPCVSLADMMILVQGKSDFNEWMGVIIHICPNHVNTTYPFLYTGFLDCATGPVNVEKQNTFSGNQ